MVKLHDVKYAMETIIRHAKRASDSLDEKQVDELIELVTNSKRVFVVGAGRSGLVVKSFAMRLMHLNFDVHVIGETVTPGMVKGDLLLAVSGSGETTFAVNTAEAAKEVGAKVAAVTSYANSSLGKFADTLVILPGRVEVSDERSYLDRQISGEYESLTPMGTLFEVGAMVFLDSVIACLMKKLGAKEEDMRARHATV